MEVDSDYEFNAPKYIDFLSTDPENEHVDSWFDLNPDGHDGGIRESLVPFLSQHSNYQDATRAISAALNDDSEDHVVNKPCQTNNKESGMETDCATEQTPTNANNVDEGCSVQRKYEEESSCVTEQEENVHKDEGMAVVKDVQQENNLLQTAEDKETADSTSDKQEKPARKLTRSNSLKQKIDTPSSNLRKRKSACTPYKSARSERPVSTGETLRDVKKPKFDLKKPMITMPNTPSFLRRLKGKKDTNKKTTEAIEIERMKKLQEETKKRRKENESFLQKALAVPVHQAKVTGLTKTMEFHFATDSRLKQHPMKTRGEDSCDGHEFSSQLRKHPPSPTFKNKKPTKPVPFHFTATSKTNKAESAPSAAWKSVASAVIDFETKTPERWRSRPASQQNIGPQCDKAKTSIQITHPKTPQLMTKRRSRPNNAPSKADEEEKIAEEIKSYKFKAKEIDHKVMTKNGMYGMPPLQTLPATNTRPFRFESDTRLEMRKKQASEKVEETDGKRSNQMEKPDCHKRDSSGTSNACAGKRRPSHTEPKPFSFEVRDKIMQQKKQEKIEKVYQEEEKAREFHARPLPSLSPEPLVVGPGRHVELAPFNLATDERGAVRVEKWTMQLRKELEEEKEKVQFKARPCTVVHKDAFVPKPSSKPLVEISEFKLNTEERSKKREDFEFTIKEQQRTKEDEMQLILKEKKEEEEQHMLLLRKQMVHKANPVRSYSELNIQPSVKPLTFPQTPNFEMKKRLGIKVSRV